MFVRPTNPVSHRLARMAFIIACVAALVVALCRSAAPLCSGSTSRPTSRSSATASISPSPPWRWRLPPSCRRDPAIAGAASWRPCWPSSSASPPPACRSTGSCAPSGRPSINDITTDTANPPPLVVTLQLRRGAPNPPAYPGASAGVLQRAAYPDIVPVILAVPPAEAFKRVDRRGHGDGLGHRRARAGRGTPRGGRHQRLVRLSRRHRRAHPCRGRAAAGSTSAPRAASANPISASTRGASASSSRD